MCHKILWTIQLSSDPEFFSPHFFQPTFCCVPVLLHEIYTSQILQVYFLRIVGNSIRNWLRYVWYVLNEIHIFMWWRNFFLEKRDESANRTIKLRTDIRNLILNYVKWNFQLHVEFGVGHSNVVESREIDVAGSIIQRQDLIFRMTLCFLCQFQNLLG